MTAPSRRQIVGYLLTAGTALFAPGGVLGAEFGRGMGMPWRPLRGEVPYYGTQPGRFFLPHERNAIAAICARLIPSGDDGPGATEADVVSFIDRQMAGFYGRAQHWYMQGPFRKGTATQGYQSEHPPARLYRLALAELDLHCRAERGGPFVDLGEAQQDEILHAMDRRKITFGRVSAKTFFDLILENTIEGFFADPIYGGNRDMVAWRYVGFPGARYDYRDFVHHNGAAISLAPVGLTGRPGWNGSQAGK